MERRGSRRNVATACTSLALGILLVAGCGDKRPPAGTDPIFTPPSHSEGGGFADAGTAPPGCGQQDDGSYCDCVDAPLFTDPPNLYFVLDHSSSMLDDGKWQSVRVTVARVLRELGARANYALTLFPGTSPDQCDPGKEVVPLRPGDPPSTTDGPTTRAFLTATLPGPNGGTPTAAALGLVLQRVEALHGRTFVILATDGGPNCNATLTCTSDTCVPNIEAVPGCDPAGESCCGPPLGTPESCLDADRTVQAVTALNHADFPVWVIGIPGSAPYASVLDQLAVAGGTAQPTSPKYYRVDSDSQDAFLATLHKIAAKITATCTFQLKEAPADPGRVNVYLDETVVPKDPANGWSLDGSTLTLLGSTCDKVLNGDVLDVRIIVGCPTIQPR